MPHGARDLAGEPLYWAVARLIHRGGMPAVTVRAAAAEARCSVGFMRHYYDTKSLMLACTYALVTDTQFRPLEEILFARRQPILNPVLPARLDAEQAADLLVTYLGLGHGPSFLIGVQLSFLATAQHDGPMGEEVGSHLGRLREDCLAVLEEVGIPRPALEDEAEGLWVLMVGLTALVPGLATEDPEERQTNVAPERVRGIVHRHLEGVVARTGVAG